MNKKKEKKVLKQVTESIFKKCVYYRGWLGKKHINQSCRWMAGVLNHFFCCFFLKRSQKDMNDSIPPFPRGLRSPWRAGIINTNNTRLKLTELSASAATGARTPPLARCSSTISWIQTEKIPHMHSKPFPDPVVCCESASDFSPRSAATLSGCCEDG